MSANLVWKVYLGTECRGAFKFVEDAACLVALLGDGATIRRDRRLIAWTEGKEEQPAAESYDYVALIAYRRLGEHLFGKESS